MGRLTCALNVVDESIDRERKLPDQVFTGRWRAFLIFASDNMFSKDFVALIKEVIRLENAECVALVNLSRDAPFQRSVIAIDGRTSPDKYMASLREGGPSNGWIYDVERYGCASDSGAWAIYAERLNDVAVLGFRSVDSRSPLATIFASLCAATVDKYDDSDSTSIIGAPGSDWRSAMLSNYRCD
ncbi:hypothetical protein [Hansschlegelia beijingensis]|uniref:Uncharacterized protein n=1 Tax=Hansschlegelia beijingensis TaxID=1133344 RepID=A0A7W6GFS9_9HYPH|nr:hypothetical protein [Hansschlegelia beijingensis]MBB3973610.1 hypothetical protein [Hansschlegelia beijingensis]